MGPLGSGKKNAAGVEERYHTQQTQDIASLTMAAGHDDNPHRALSYRHYSIDDGRQDRKANKLTLT